MAETLKRHRESLAWVVLGASIAYIVISLVNLAYLASQVGGIIEAARVVAGSSLSVVMALLVLATTLCCVLLKPVTPRAGRIVQLGALVVGLAALLEFLFLVIGLFGGRFGAFGAILELVGGMVEVLVKAAIAWLLWRTLQGQGLAAPATTHDAPVVVEPAAPQVGETTAASWSVDEAAGAVWQRAGDAASGAQATTWGHPGRQTSGWQAAAQETQPHDAPRTVPAGGAWATAGELASGTAEVRLDPGAVRGSAETTDDAPRRSVSWDVARESE